MTSIASLRSEPSTRQIAVGAEWIAAAQFARHGFDVSVQTGAEKPRYDLVVARAGDLLKVSVKGSDNGRWDLAQPYLKRAADGSVSIDDCHRAIDRWLDHHSTSSVCCLVQFRGVAIDELPRMYLATPAEIGKILRETVDRFGGSILYEEYERAFAVGGSQVVERLPASWRLSSERIEQLLPGGAPRKAERPALAKPSQAAEVRVPMTIAPPAAVLVPLPGIAGAAWSTPAAVAQQSEVAISAWPTELHTASTGLLRPHGLFVSTMKSTRTTTFNSGTVLLGD